MFTNFVIICSCLKTCEGSNIHGYSCHEVNIGNCLEEMIEVPGPRLSDIGAKDLLNPIPYSFFNLQVPQGEGGFHPA